MLENRLDKALIKYNEALSKNKGLRSLIDDLRREKNVYDGIYKKLERDLNEKKRIMADIIEMSNQSYEARDQSEHEIELIKRQMREREELWEAELKQQVLLAGQAQDQQKAQIEQINCPFSFYVLSLFTNLFD